MLAVKYLEIETSDYLPNILSLSQIIKIKKLNRINFYLKFYSE